MISHEELLNKYLDRELSPDEEVQFKQLLSDDLNFKKEVNIMSAIKEEAKDMPKTSQFEHFELKKQHRFHFRHYIYGILTATLLFFIVNSGYYFTTGMNESLDYSYSMDVEESANRTYDTAVESKGDDGVSMLVGEMQDDMIIYNSSLSIIVDSSDEAVDAINGFIKQTGAYIESINSYTNPPYIYYENNKKYESPETKYYYMTIRVPQDQLDTLTDSIEELGEVTNYSKSAYNVSEQYTDLEARLKLHEDKLARLYELMDEAGDLGDLIALESAISDEIYQIESINSQMKDIEKRVDYSYLTVYLSERAKAEIKISDNNFWQEIKDAFIYSFNAFVATIFAFLKFLIYAIPYIIVLGVIYIIVKSLFRRRKKN